MNIKKLTLRNGEQKNPILTKTKRNSKVVDVLKRIQATTKLKIKTQK